MSYSTLLVVRPDGSVEGDAELRNSWGTAPRIWDPIFDRHFNPKPLWGGEPSTNWMLMREPDQKRFWQLAGDESLPLFVRQVFELTFDKTVVAREDCAALADAVEQFDREYPVDPNRVNHLPAVAKWLRGCANREDLIAVGMNCTSVHESFTEQLVDPEDEESDELRPFNIYTDGARQMVNLQTKTLYSDRPTGAST